MKKLITILSAILLIVCLTGTCFADAYVPCREPAQTGIEQQADPQDAGQPQHLAFGYSYTYTRQRTSPISKAIAAAIVGLIAMGIKKLTGGDKKGDANNAAAAQNAAAPENTAAPAETGATENVFVCKSCGATCSGWYQTCPYCGSVGQMEKKK